MANIVDPDETARYEPFHLDLHCLQRHLHWSVGRKGLSCIGNKGRKALVAFSVLVLVQLSLIIGLLVLGIKGKEEIGTEREVGVPYYVGAIIVAAVFMLPVIQIIAVIILSSLEEEYCITDCFVVGSCLFTFFGILVCILGMIFLIAFGIADCQDRPEDYTDVGFCSYDSNIETNYTIAVVALVLVIIMLISTGFSFYLFSNYSEALVSRKKNTQPVNTAPTNNRVTPVNVATEPTSAFTTQQRNSNLLTQLQVQHLQQRNRDLQTQINIMQSGFQPLPHPGPVEPPPYSSESAALSDPVYPPNSNMVPMTSFMGNTQDLPPSYESVMNNAGINQVPENSQARPSSHRTSSYTQRTLRNDTQRNMNRVMIRDRERRNDQNRQKKIGVPENRMR